AADGVAENRPIAPVRADKARLPDVLDLQRVLAKEKRLEVLIDGSFDDASTLGERGAAKPIEAGFVGQHLDDDQADAARSSEYGLDICDLDSLQLLAVGV